MKATVLKLDSMPDSKYSLKNEYKFELKHNIDIKLSNSYERFNNCYLRDIQIIIDGNDLTEKFVEYKTVVDSDLYMPLSKDNQFIFIPSTKTSCLINTETLERIDIESASYYYYGNIFFNDHQLLTIGSKDVVLYDTKSKKAIRYVPMEIDTYKIQWAFLNEDLDSVVIIYNDFEINSQFWKVYDKHGKILGGLDILKPSDFFDFNISNYLSIQNENQFGLALKEGGQLNSNMLNTWQFDSFNPDLSEVYCWTPVPCSGIFLADDSKKYCKVDIKKVKIKIK